MPTPDKKNKQNEQFQENFFFANLEKKWVQDRKIGYKLHVVAVGRIAVDKSNHNSVTCERCENLTKNDKSIELLMNLILNNSPHFGNDRSFDTD